MYKCPDSGLTIKVFDDTTYYLPYMQISMNHWNGQAGIFNHQEGFSDKSEVYIVYSPNDTASPGKIFWSVSCHLLITQLSPRNIQGKFHALLVDRDTKTDTISTDGEFNVPFN